MSVVALVGGCGQERTAQAEEGLTPGAFVEIITALREAEREVTGEDSAQALFEGRKAEILAREGVTEAELRAFIAAQGQDVTRLEQTWDSIAQRLKHVPEERERSQREPVQREPPPPPVPADTGEQRLH